MACAVATGKVYAEVSSGNEASESSDACGIVVVADAEVAGPAGYYAGSGV